MSIKNSEIVKIIKFHNNQLGLDCPCVLRASGQIEVHDESRMPRDDAELTQWESEYNSSVDLTGQISECIKLLDHSEIHVSNDPPYPDDVNAWKIARAKWRVVLKSDKIKVIAERPF